MGKPYVPRPFNGTELWLNQCVKCGSCNPSRPKHIPKVCSGCGYALETNSDPNWKMGYGSQHINVRDPRRTKVAPTP